MFEGQNIHLSPIDGKRLCSFSRKLCKQRRLNGYAFCIRHILEDKAAPFKQCQFKIRTNGEQCFNPVPIDAERIYCSSHLQVLGLLPKNTSKKINLSKKIPAKCQSSKKDGKAVVVNNKIGDNGWVNSLITSAAAEVSSLGNLVNIEFGKNSKDDADWVLGKNVPGFKNSKMYTRNRNVNIKYFQMSKHSKQQPSQSKTYYVVQENNFFLDDCPEIFQNTILSTSDRVHHNHLRTDTISHQESKLLARLKHQCGQLKVVLNSKKQSGKLSYSVLSKLVSDARSNACETTNILLSQPSDESTSRCLPGGPTYRIPCCLISGTDRCPNTALPFMKHCKEHVKEDLDQVLFCRPMREPSRKCSSIMSLNFLNSDEHNLNAWKKTTEIMVSQSSLKQRKPKQSAAVKRFTNRKNTKMKRSKKVNGHSLKAQMQKKFAIPCKPSMKLNAHLKNTHSRKPSYNYDPSFQLSDDDVENSQRTSECDSESDSDTDESECDILTPEDAFHLPAGSLSSFSSRIEDDDSLSAIRQSCDIEDDDDELMRCTNNFGFELNTQMSRDLASPTLNQLSSSDFDSTFNMLLSPVKTISSNNVAMQQSTGCNIRSMETTRQEASNTPQPLSKRTSAVTSLKITPVTANVRTINFNSGIISKSCAGNTSFIPINGNSRSGHPSLTTVSQATSRLNNGFVSLDSFGKLTNGHTGQSKGVVAPMDYQHKTWTKSHSSDTLFPSPFDHDVHLYDATGGAMDSSPLEKVNPDIFFSSVFPVTTSTTNV